MERKILKFNEKEMRRIDDFRYASKEKQRFLVYANFIGAADRIIKYETDEKLCYFREVLTPSMGTVGYIKRQTLEGFTFDKKTKKLKIWFGKKLIKMSQSLIYEMMSDLNASWYKGMNNNLQMVSTRMIFEKIFKGSIQSPAQFCESYVKYHLKVKGVDYLSYYSLILDGGVGIGDLNHYLKHAADPEDFIKNFHTYKHILDHDALNSCRILGIKFDWSLSPEAAKEKKREMTHAINKLRKEWSIVQEFYGYITHSYDPDPNLPF